MLQPRSFSGHLGDGGAPRRRTLEPLAALSSGLDAAEGRPEGHAIRTALIAGQFAESLERAEETRAALLYAALLRDAGTTGRSTAAPRGGRLGLVNRRAARQAAPPAHLSRPDRAAAVIHSLGLPAAVAEAVYSVDERWDGRGPMGLRRDSIPVGAIVLAAASVAASALRLAIVDPDLSATEIASTSLHRIRSALRSARTPTGPGDR